MRKRSKSLVFAIMFAMSIGQVTYAEEEIISNDSIAETIETVDEETEEVDDTKEVLCVDYPLIWSEHFYDDMDEGYEYQTFAESSDSSVCEISDIEFVGDSIVRCRVTGKSKGNATIRIGIEKIDDNGDSISRTYFTREVVVKELPDDAVEFEDDVLRTLIIQSGRYYDSSLKKDIHFDEKGYVCYDDMKQVSSLDLSGAPGMEVTNLSGLEYASNLSSLNLSDNPELEDISILNNWSEFWRIDFTNCSNLSNIDALFGLSLFEVDLGGTAVSTEDRIKLLGNIDGNVAKGSKIKLPHIGGVFGDTFSVEENNTDNFSIEKEEYLSYCEMVAQKEGESEIVINYEGGSAKFNFNVEGIDAVQEVNEPYDKNVDMIRINETNKKIAILNSNGDLWKVYPEAKIVDQDVKKYVADWVYFSGDDNSTKRECWLDENNTLWSGEEELANNIVKFDTRYALDTDSVLNDTYLSEAEDIEQVKDWRIVAKTESYTQTAKLYVLKNDGTLWQREEKKDQLTTNDTFEKIDENVQEIFAIKEMKYLKDGEIINVDTGECEAENVSSFVAEEYGDIYQTFYYSNDGNLHLIDSRCLGDSDIGNVGNVKSIITLSAITRDNPYYKIFIQNESDELFMYQCSMEKIMLGEYEWEYDISGKGEVSYLAENVAELAQNANGDWVARLQNGTYYDENGTVINLPEVGEIILERLSTKDSKTLLYSTCEIVLKSSGEKFFRKNGVELLNDVKSIQTSIDGSAYVLRTDGTAWDVTGVPKMIIDLSTSTVVKGDLNDDGVINIEDLRIILGGVCEKAELTEEQVMAADIIEDGSVDIQDLRQELRYVCGKITEL